MLHIKNPIIILGLLTAAYTLSFMDRYVLNLVLNDIKRDFHLSEMESGLIAGAGFAVLYALMAMPMGMIADRWHRMRLAALGIGFWSIVTTLCGFSRNFLQLLMCRTGVGIGEAALTPAAYPVIKSLFPPARLSTAIGVYSSGIYIGSGLAYWLGGYILGYINSHPLASPLHFVKCDWQMVFILFGVPGMIVALLMLRVRIPDSSPAPTATNIGELIIFLKTDKYRFLKLTLASALFNVAVYAAGVWLPAYLQRVHKMDVVESGRILGAAMIFIAPLGVIAGGVLGDRMSISAGSRGRVYAIIAAIALVMSAFMLLSFDLPAGFSLCPLLLLSLLLGMPVAITAAMIQQISPDHIRSTAPAFMLMIQNLIGMGLGPTIVAILTQYIFHDINCVGTSISITGFVFCSLSMLLFYHTQKQMS